jgi:heptose I phosphotransferase
MVYLAADLKPELSEQKLFAQVDALEGEVFRNVSGRRTFRFELNSKPYFAKIHYGVGWWEIIKNLLQFRLPVLGASNEWHAINKLQELDIDTLTAVAYSTEGKNPAQLKSLIITRSLEDTLSLEELVSEGSASLALKRQLITKLAKISRVLHDNGVNHRDYYLCHFLMPRHCVDAAQVDHLYLIDLHRVQIRSGGVPRRWLEKDLAGLLFSAADAGLTRRDVLRFVRDYSGAPLREALRTNQTMWHQVVRKADRLFEKDQGHSSDFLKTLVQWI